MNIPMLTTVGIMLASIGIVLGLAMYGASLVASARDAPPITRFAYIFLLTIGLQGVHFIEHIAQMLQAFVFHILPARGLIGQLDLEQVHFVFNTLYLALMINLFLSWLNVKEELPKRWMLFAVVLFLTVTAQSYHEVEHVVKLVQFFNTNKQGTPGILGGIFHPVIVHFMMNAIVFVPAFVVFFGSGLHKQLLLRLPRRSGPPTPATP